MKKVIGILMGADPVPVMANPFLYYSENKGVLNVVPS